MIKIENLSYVYPYDHTVLENVNLEINRGDFWGVLGQNGSGKTTLVDLILGLKKPSEGAIKFFDEKDDSVNRVTYLSQDVNLLGTSSVREFLDFHSFFYMDYSFDDEKYLLDYFDLREDVAIGALSTGQQKKAQIIAGLSSGLDLIVVDEITAVLDPGTRTKFFNLLTKFNKDRGKTIILATNILQDLEGRVDNVLEIRNGRSTIFQSSNLDWSRFG